MTLRTFVKRVHEQISLGRVSGYRFGDFTSSHGNTNEGANKVEIPRRNSCADRRLGVETRGGSVALMMG